MKLFEALGQEIAIGMVFGTARCADALTVKALEPLRKHRTIGLAEDLLGNVDDTIGVYAKQIAVISRVVKIREAQAIGDDWCATLVAVGENMGGFQKRNDGQIADGASTSVGI